jgi:hypothetical protein
MRGLWRALKWTGAALILCLAALWLGDYVSVRYRMLHKTAADPVESIVVHPIYAIPHKDGKDEFDFGDAENVTCVHSLFPHLGYNPCWYVLRESQKPISIAALVQEIFEPARLRKARPATYLADPWCERYSVEPGIPRFPAET